MSTNKEKTTITIWRKGSEFKISLNEDKDELTIEKYCDLNIRWRWKINICNKGLDPECEGNKRLNCVELYNLLTQADMPDSNNLWHLKNTNHAVKYPTWNDPFTAPVLNIWTNVNDPFESLYTIVLRQKKKK